MFAKPLLEKRKPFLGMGFKALQTFAREDDGDEDEGDDDDQEGGGDPAGDETDLKELLKDPKYKKQYQEMFKEQLNKRMKKYKDIDPDEYRRLKEQADKAKGKQEKEEEDDKEDLKSKLSEKDQQLLRAERREKKAIVKEFAIENGYNARLLARLIDIDKVELDDDGEPENLEELFEEIQEEFPEYFSDQDDEEEEKERRKKGGSYRPGSHQRGNTARKEDKRAKGAQRALQRHKKEEDK